MKYKKILPVILCGGSGSRLWPLSRESFPKQFLSLDNNRKTFLQKTQERLKNLDNVEDPIILCNEAHRFIVAEQLREINIIPKKIILEPCGRNTAPAITLAAIIAIENYSDINLLILSADHEIKNIERFLEIIKKGMVYSEENNLVTFGVIPSSPETGFGYIESEKPFKRNYINGSKIKRFVEKPDLEKAKQLIKSKCFTWNSGIFLFKAKAILNEIKKFSPETLYYCEESLKKKTIDLDFQRIEESSFKKCPNISIDYAVMEKTSKGIVLPLDVFWSDIGNWKSVWENSEKDKEGNALHGKVIIDKTNDCLIRAEDRLVVSIGLKDLLIIETSDVVMVANKDNAQDIKNIVSKLKQKNISEGIEHKKMFRPWGFYISILEESRWKVKVIQVKPGEQLSLQMHHHRSEHWVVVTGTAKVEIDNKEMILSENKSCYIPLGSKHRLSNPGKIPLKLIEIQSGNYVGEDDIERFEDNYGRIK
tara:strand:+ start:788 stop:2224 length:1437 start_codon:yes stop_codon:yes gene_type:complete